MGRISVFGRFGCARRLPEDESEPGHMKEAENVRKGGEPCWVRTSDLLIKSQLLYRLS